MNGGEQLAMEEGAEWRPIVYCLIPAELAPKLHELLRRHFSEDPNVEVVVERRHRERRSGRDRRVGEGAAPAAERRRIRSASGRRIAERRAALVEVEPPRPLPRRARRYAERLRFVERLEPSTQEAEDRDTARVVARFQAGDSEAFSTLYTRYFDRVYGYLRVALADHHEAEDAAQQVFTQIFERLSEYERRAQPFRSWLFTAVRNAAITELRKRHRVDLEDPLEARGRLEQATAAEDAPFALGWITDPDLLIFVERLPVPQRQVLLLRYMLDLPSKEVAEILGRSPVEVRKLQSRALAFLRERLASVGRTSASGRDRAQWRRRLVQVGVLRERRYALRK